MAVEFTVELEGAGGLARVITALKRLGLGFSSHHIEPIGENRSRLTINAEGSADATALREALAQVKGVAQVVRIGSQELGGQSPTVAATPTLESVPAPEVEPHTQARPRPSAPARRPAGLGATASLLVADYPRILPHIDAFEEALPSNRNLALELRRLGRWVGAKLSEQDNGLRGGRSLHEALEQATTGILSRICEPELVGRDVRVRLSIFTRRQVNTMDLVFGGEASHCDFLSGMIEGIVKGIPGLPDIRVRETSCRTNGDEYCLFHVSA